MSVRKIWERSALLVWVTAIVGTLLFFAAVQSALYALGGRSRFELMGNWGIPNRCRLTLDSAGFERSQLQIVLKRSDEPDLVMFDGASCRHVPTLGGDGWSLHYWYRAQDICASSPPFDILEERVHGGDRFLLRCGVEEGVPACRGMLGDVHLYTTCYPHSSE